MKQLIISIGLALAMFVPNTNGDDSASQPKLVPLSVFVAKLNPESPDYYSDVAFIGIRSAALFTTLAGYFEENARGEQDKELAKALMTKAEVFVFVGTSLDVKFNKKSPEVIKEQLQKLNKIYWESMKENRLLNNTVESPLIASDFKAANSVFGLFQGLEKVIKEKK